MTYETRSLDTPVRAQYEVGENCLKFETVSAESVTNIVLEYSDWELVEYAHLTQRQAEAWLWRDIYGWDYASCLNTMGVTDDTFCEHLRKARQRIALAREHFATEQGQIERTNIASDRNLPVAEESRNSDYSNTPLRSVITRESLERLEALLAANGFPCRRQKT